MPKKAAAKRRPPRRKALNRAQAEQMLARYNRLLADWVAKLAIISRRVSEYQRKALYYQGRVDTLHAAEMAELAAARDAAEETAGRELRSIAIPERS